MLAWKKKYGGRKLPISWSIVGVPCSALRSKYFVSEFFFLYLICSQLEHIFLTDKYRKGVDSDYFCQELNIFFLLSRSVLFNLEKFFLKVEQIYVLVLWNRYNKLCLRPIFFFYPKYFILKYLFLSCCILTHDFVL